MKFKIQRTSPDGKVDKAIQVNLDANPKNKEYADQLIALAKSPLRLLLNGSKLGIKGVKNYVSLMLGFLVLNIVLWIVAVSLLVSTGFTVGKFSIVLLIFLIGVFVIAYAGYRGYRYAIFDVILAIYKQYDTLVKKLSDTIVDKSFRFYQEKKETKSPKLSKALDFTKMVNSISKGIPGFFQKRLVTILNKIPFVDFIKNIESDISSGNVSVASEKLFTSMDRFVRETLLGSASLTWAWWLFAENIIIVGIFIYILVK